MEEGSDSVAAGNVRWRDGGVILSEQDTSLPELVVPSISFFIQRPRGLKSACFPACLSVCFFFSSLLALALFSIFLVVILIYFMV